MFVGHVSFDVVDQHDFFTNWAVCRPFCAGFDFSAGLEVLLEVLLQHGGVASIASGFLGDFSHGSVKDNFC